MAGVYCWSSTSSENNNSNNNSSGNNPIPKGSWFIIVIGIVIAAIGFAGTIFYGSQFVKEEVNANGGIAITNTSHIKNILPIDLKTLYVVIGLIEFEIFTYGFATKADKPLTFILCELIIIFEITSEI